MEKRKFTDGEWIYVPEDNGFAVRNDDNEIICTSADAEVMENDANGKLLSAAKDLHIASINALKEIQKVIREGAINRRDLEAAASDLTDAIYKARVGDE